MVQNESTVSTKMTPEAIKEPDRIETKSIMSYTDIKMSLNAFTSHQQLSTTSSTKTNTFNSIHNEYELLVGVVYVQDLSSNEVGLGTILLKNVLNKKANLLRENIQKELLFPMNEDYVFFTKFGHISIEQENEIEIRHLIYPENIVKIRRNYGTGLYSLIGADSNSQKIFFGFIRANYQMDLKTIRNIVNEYRPNFKDWPPSNFNFLHNFDCIIAANNENQMNLIDITRNNTIAIKFESGPLESDISFRSLMQSDRPRIKYDICNNSNSNLSEDITDSFIRKNKSTMNKIFDKKMTRSIYKKNQKQIMISYVRRDSADNALRLKKSLLKCGFSVYLDVHEIKRGMDWQDSLNSGVQNCHYFIPLITQNYGLTKWTNREVKLADTHEKHIIPINFLSKWPPDCLAIQFASTQFIPWNYDPNSHGMSDNTENDINKLWDDNTIEPVTKEIEKRIKDLEKKDINPKWRFLQENKEEIRLTEKKIQMNECANQVKQKRKLIVISSDPAQSEIADKISSILKNEDFDVWCSKDATNERLSKNCRQTNDIDQYLPTISEEPVVPRPVQDFARRIAENSKQRPKSVPNHDGLGTISFKKDLSRGFSYGDSKTSDEQTTIHLDFQEKVSQSSLVILLLSEQYHKSDLSIQHVFYCAQRVEVILVNCDQSHVPPLVSKLYINHGIMDYKNSTFKQDLLDKIKRTLDPDSKEMENMHEVKIKSVTDCMKKNIPNPETCVYVFGSVETKYLPPRTPEICQAIGKKLAKFKNITIITNGSYGTGDIVAYTFQTERVKDSIESSIIHIVPTNKDYSSPTNLTYGQKLFLPEDITKKERDSVVARMLDTVVLIGGNKDSVHEIEEILWNDHFVIPIKASGGAAAGEFGVPEKIFSRPNGVNENSWNILLNPDAEPEHIATALAKVIHELKAAIYNHATSKDVKSITQSLSNNNIANRPLKRRLAERRKKTNADTKDLIVNDEDNINNYNNASSSSMTSSESPLPEKTLPMFHQPDQQQTPHTLLQNIQNRFRKGFRHFFGT